MPNIKSLVRQYEGTYIKENDEQMLIDLEGTGEKATWYLKALMEGTVRNPTTDVVCFTATSLAAGRTVKLK